VPASTPLTAILPTADEEIWRYSRIGELDLARFEAAAVDTTVTGADGIMVASPTEADLDVVGGDAPDVFHQLNRERVSPVVLRVRAGAVVENPVIVTHRCHGNGSALFPRLVIDAGADSEITVVERFVSDDDDDVLVVPVVQIRAAAAARVRYVGINELGRRAWSIGHQQSVGDRDSSVLLGTVALGGDYARVRTDARVVGPGASTRQIAIYFADGDQMHDFRPLQDHAAPKTHSDLLFKGAVAGRAKSVYTGLIKMRHEAKGSQAFQTNRNLTLSDEAWAESVPNLDIETNDVKCSHASTVGPIDEEQRFYLESRGVPPDVAERLVVLGFFDEVLSQLPIGDLAGELRERVAAKLGGVGSLEVAR
jgi:Fe-S cluster assembly protein SufD